MPKRRNIEDMTIEELRSRAAEIRTAVTAPDADLDALDTEATAISERIAQYDAETRRRQIAEKVANGEGTVIRKFSDSTLTEERSFDIGSPEYRTAWLKKIAIDERGNKLFGELNEVESRAYTFLTTNSSAVVPKDTLNKIVELVRSEAPMLADATPSFFTRGFGVPRHKAIDAGDAKAVSEGEANDDEQDTFDLLPLDGVEIKKSITMSKKMQIQSLDAFEQWLVQHLADRIRVAKEKQILTRLDNTSTGIAETNKITGKLSDDEVRKIFSLIKADGAKAFYANSSMIWNVLAGLTDSEGRKLFIPNSMSDPIVAGRIYGAAIKQDNNIADNTLYAGVAKSILSNDFDELEIVPQIENKTLKRIFTAYSLYDAGLEDPEAMVKYTHTPG